MLGVKWFGLNRIRHLSALVIIIAKAAYCKDWISFNNSLHIDIKRPDTRPGYAT